MRYRISIKFLWATVALAVVLAVVEFVMKPEQTLAFIALGAILVGLIQTFVYFRCPHCKARWDVRRGIPSHCPHCGKTIK